MYEMRQKPLVNGTLTLLHKTFLAIGLYSLFYFKHLSGAWGSNSTDIFPHSLTSSLPSPCHSPHACSFASNTFVTFSDEPSDRSHAGQQGPVRHETRVGIVRHASCNILSIMFHMPALLHLQSA